MLSMRCFRSSEIFPGISFIFFRWKESMMLAISVSRKASPGQGIRGLEEHKEIDYEGSVPMDISGRLTSTLCMDNKKTTIWFESLFYCTSLRSDEILFIFVAFY